MGKSVDRVLWHQKWEWGVGGYDFDRLLLESDRKFTGRSLGRGLQHGEGGGGRWGGWEEWEGEMLQDVQKSKPPLPPSSRVLGAGKGIFKKREEIYFCLKVNTNRITSSLWCKAPFDIRMRGTKGEESTNCGHKLYCCVLALLLTAYDFPSSFLVLSLLI